MSSPKSGNPDFPAFKSWIPASVGMTLLIFRNSAQSECMVTKNNSEIKQAREIY